MAKTSIDIRKKMVKLREELRAAQKAELAAAKESVCSAFTEAGFGKTAEDLTVLAAKLRVLLAEPDFREYVRSVEVAEPTEEQHEERHEEQSDEQHEEQSEGHHEESFDESLDVPPTEF